MDWIKDFIENEVISLKYLNKCNVHKPTELGGIDHGVGISNVTSIKEKICSPKHGLIWSPDVVVRNMQRF